MFPQKQDNAQDD